MLSQSMFSANPADPSCGHLTDVGLSLPLVTEVIGGQIEPVSNRKNTRKLKILGIFYIKKIQHIYKLLAPLWIKIR